MLVLNLVVAAAKILAGSATASMAMMADGWHSLLDSVSTIVGLVGVTIAAAPPDRDHPYGHGRFEVAAALVIAVMLLLAAWGVVAQAVGRISSGAQPSIGPMAFAVILASMTISAGVTLWESRVGRRLRNRVLLADAGHTRSDVYTSLAVLVSFIFVRAGYPLADLLVAAIVGVVIALAGYRIVRDALSILSDTAPIDVERVTGLFRPHPELGRVHAVRSRSNGSDVYVDLQVQLPGTMSVDESHAITERIEDLIRQEFPEVVDIVVHVEPD